MSFVRCFPRNTTVPSSEPDTLPGSVGSHPSLVGVIQKNRQREVYWTEIGQGLKEDHGVSTNTHGRRYSCKQEEKKRTALLPRTFLTSYRHVDRRVNRAERLSRNYHVKLATGAERRVLTSHKTCLQASYRCLAEVNPSFPIFEFISR